MAENIPRFGADEFWTIETDPAVIREQLREALTIYLGYSPTDNDPRMLEALALMPYIVQTRALADAAAKSALLSYAQGEELDRIADSTCIYGYMDRLPAAPAVMWIRLNFELGTTGRCEYSGTFEAGGYAWSGEGVYIQEFGAQTTDNVFVPFFSQTPGAGANGIDSGVIQDLGTLIADGVQTSYTGGTVTAGLPYIYNYGGTIVCEVPTRGGRDAESDEAFAKRISEQMRALRVPGASDYYSHTARKFNGISDVYTSENLDANGYVQIWYTSPYTYAWSEGGVNNYVICGVTSAWANTYQPFRDAMADLKPVGAHIVLAPAFHDLNLETGVRLTIYNDASPQEEADIKSALRQRILGAYDDRLGGIMTAEEIDGWAQELGAAAARVTFPDGATDVYQVAPNICAPVQLLTFGASAYIPREKAAQNTGSVGEEVL